MYISNQKVSARLAERILNFIAEGLPEEPLIRFHKNLITNTNFEVVDKLFNFLEANHYPITYNGTFIAYKLVKKDFNPFIGSVVIGQVTSFGGVKNHTKDNVVLEVEIHPGDVIKISDRDLTVSEYRIIGVIPDSKNYIPIKNCFILENENNTSLKNEIVDITQLESEDDTDENIDDYDYAPI